MNMRAMAMMTTAPLSVMRQMARTASNPLAGAR